MSQPRETWPDGSAVAVTMSFDDGTVHDRRLVAMLNERQLLATFFVSCGKLGAPAAASHMSDYLKAEEVRGLYAGHEVGGHTLDHPVLTELSDGQIDHQVRGNRARLTELLGYEPSGFASPFGAQDARTAARVRAAGYRYQRGIGRHQSFAPPADPFDWKPGFHCLDDLDSALRRALHADAQERRLVAIWGHSWEFNQHDRWDRFEVFLGQLAQERSRVWVAAHTQVVAALSG